MDFIKYIKENYHFGKNYCARETGLPYCRITKIFKELNLNPDPIEVLKNQYDKKYAKQTEIYSKILDLTDPINIYLLGFLWADGSLAISKSSSTLSCQIKLTDAEYLDQLFIAKNFKLRRVDQKLNGKIYPMRVYQLHSKKVCEKLINLGFIKNKSNEPPTQLLQNIPENLKYLWWRGYFDGDGSIYFHKKGAYRFNICNVYDCDWGFAEEFFKKNDIEYFIARTISNKGHRSSTINVTKRENCIKFGKIILDNYDKYPFGLKRKHEVFGKIEDHLKWIMEEKIHNRSFAIFSIDKNQNKVYYRSIRDACRKLNISDREMFSKYLDSNIEYKNYKFYRIN